MKIAVLGPGDYSLISKHSKLKEKDVSEIIERFGKFLAENNFEIIIAVDRGFPYEVAKVYKKYKGKKVYGVNPQSHEKYDKQEAIKPYMDVIDEEIKVASWYHLNGEIASLSDVAVAFGLSCGTLADIVFLYFHYKYLKSKTRLIMYLPSMSSKLHSEIEESLSIKGKKFEYVNSLEELENKLLEYKNESKNRK
jgi:predicted Rossmann-fold nucleotide-binding protein